MHTAFGKASAIRQAPDALLAVFTNRVENANALGPQSHRVGPCSEGWLKSWKKLALQNTRSTTGCPGLGGCPKVSAVNQASQVHCTPTPSPTSSYSDCEIGEHYQRFSETPLYRDLQDNATVTIRCQSSSSLLSHPTLPQPGEKGLKASLQTAGNRKLYRPSPHARLRTTWCRL